MARLERRARRRRKSRDDRSSGRLITLTDPGDAAAEAYRSLRTNLLYALVDAPPRVIVVTSPSLTEGKSTTCTNLGVVLAQAGKDTLILDCDFRQPTIHKLFGLQNTWGMVNVLARECGLQEVCQEPQPGLKVVPAGPVPPNPTELVGSESFARLLDQARQSFDYVLVDGPPTQLFSDPLILSAQGDGVLLVIDAQSTRKASVRQSVRSLKAVGANVLGTVMNNVETPEVGYYRYGSTHGEHRQASSRSGGQRML